MPFAAVTHPAEGLCLDALLNQKLEYSLICVVDIQRTTVSMIECQFILPLKELIKIF
jgi:hypothetical protein